MPPPQGSPQISRPEVWRSEVEEDELAVMMLLVCCLKNPRSAVDRVRGVWTGQDRKPEEHTKASESAMAVVD